LYSLESYLRDVCGFEKDEKGRATAAQGEQKDAFDAGKIKHLIEELSEPVFIHVSARTSPPTSRILETHIASQLKA
jgi:hypothetical protein